MGIKMEWEGKGGLGVLDKRMRVEVQIQALMGKKAEIKGKRSECDHRGGWHLRDQISEPSSGV